MQEDMRDNILSVMIPHSTIFSRSYDHFGDPEKPVAVMAPNGRIRFPIIRAVNGNWQSQCVVTREDELGEHETPPTTVQTI
jgi:hypothetical protein